MSDVTWLVHPLYDLYEVSSDGGIRRRKNGRELKPYPHPQHLYFQTCLSTIQGRKTVRFHRMVCETFHGLPPTPDHEVRHLNGVKTDNRAENLAWGTPSENMQDKKLHGTDYWSNQTHCINGHAFNEKNTYIRKCGRGYRMCRECDRIKQKQRRDAHLNG